jgi:plastocyanin
MSKLAVRLVLGAILALALCGGALAAPSGAGTTWQVVVGGESADHALSAQAFLPTSITINEGDTINWTFASFHTVTFLSGGSPPPLALPAGNDLAFNPAIAFPSGGPTYDGTGYVNSGTLPGEGGNSFALTFTKAGTYGYVCLLHPGMAGQVVVQAVGSAYPATQAEVTAKGNAELYDKLGYANSLLTAAQVMSKPSGGATSYTIANGVGGNQASVIRFLPVDLTIKAGDSVTWTVNDPHEIHTVTFYDPAGPMPIFLDPQPQPNGPPTLFLRNAAPAGGTTVDKVGLYNSGIMGPGQSYTLTFAKPGVYNYLCVIHAELGQTGKIVVTEAGAPASLPNTGTPKPDLPIAWLAGAALLLALLGALVRRWALARAA